MDLKIVKKCIKKCLKKVKKYVDKWKMEWYSIKAVGKRDGEMIKWIVCRLDNKSLETNRTLITEQ